MIPVFKIIGGLGILLIAIGLSLKERQLQDIFYICGGICLEVYSIYINDFIFIVLQLVFTFAAVYDLVRLKYLEK